MASLINLRELRKRRGLTQADLASLLEVEQSTIHRWEAGKQEPALGHLVGLANSLGVGFEVLLGLSEPGASPTSSNDTGPPDDRPIYRLLTGKDDRAFCERVSEALEQGWRLYGSPILAWDEEGGYMKAAQAVVWKDADVVR